MKTLKRNYKNENSSVQKRKKKTHKNKNYLETQQQILRSSIVNGA